MDAKSIERVVSEAVSSALAQLTSTSTQHPPASTAPGNSDEDDFQLPPHNKKRKTSLPSSFLTRRDAKLSKKKSGKDFVYDRDIICIPKCSGTSAIKIPRSKDVREMLGRSGLIGKIRLTSSMSEGQIMDEIRSVFRKPMKGKSDFAFRILQPSGGTSKTLSIPALSSSFRWTAGAIAGKNSKMPIYVMADEDVELVDTDSSEDDLPGFQVGHKLPVKQSKSESVPLGRKSSAVSDEPARKSSQKQPTIVTGDGPSTSSGRTAGSQYRKYINLLSSDSESEPLYSPTPPPLSPITPQPELACISLQSLLISHRNQVLSSDRDDTYRIKVRRKHVWEDALHHFKCGLPATLHLRVTFLGEPAVDAGGPLREFLHLLMCEIARNNTLFCGDETARVPNHNMVELAKKTYEYVGSMLAVSIVHGGPAPHFFAHGVADYIMYGLDHVHARVEDIPDVIVKDKLMKLLDTSNEMEFRELLNTDEYDFRYECGISQPVTSFNLSDRDKIVSAIAMHYSVVRVKAELDQIMNGLKVLRIGELIKANPQKMRELFVHFKPLSLTADALFDMFPARLSPIGSNKREAEEAALMKWVNYTQAVEDCGGSLKVTTPEGNITEFEISLELIVSFATGMPEEPPLGFCPKPAILFLENSKFPSANTCANQINLPLQDMTFEEFKYNMTYCIMNAAGFGQI